ncbi:hypothetical protein C8Q74DRAFT_1208445 [Fomes fomentarius]|nr:hypothetical protein C8Q74DRAFT_1208445 [Fomes fomentarius]
MTLSNDLSALVGFACEAVFWGVYVVLFLTSIVLLLRRASTRSVNLPIFIANVFLFGSCTAHFALEFDHFFRTLSATGVRGFADETAKLMGADILISLSDFLGDLILIYRCWVIWNKNLWVVFFPFLTAAGGFACIIVVAHFVLMLSPSSPVPPAAIVPLGMAGYVLPLATNAMATALIVAKLWLTASRAEKRVGTRMRGTARAAQRAVAIIVESGLLYLVTQLVFAVLFGLGHPAQAILAVIAVQIYGIAPTLIIIQVALGISTEQTTAPPRKSASMTRVTVASGRASSAQAHPPSFLPALSSATDDSTLRQDAECLELKSLDLDFDDMEVAVAV